MDPLILAQAQPPPTSSDSTPPSPEAKAAAAAAAEDDDEEEEEGPARIPLAGVQQGGVLLQRDQLVLEPSLSYSFSTNSRLILTGFSILPLLILGTIEAENVENQTFSPSLGFRYGIRRGIQTDIRIPFVLNSQSRTRVLSDQTGQQSFRGEDAGLSDVSFGLSYQFLYERAWIPDMVFRLGASAPTGRSQFDIFEDIIAEGNFDTIDQFEAALTSEGGETLLQLTANPANPREIIVVPVEADLGGNWNLSVSLGMAISLNNQLSTNWSFAYGYRWATERNGVKIPDSAVTNASFNMGFNIAVTPRITTNVVGSFGLTPDSPDFSFSLTTPVSFTNAVGSTVTWLKEHRPFKSKPAPQIPEEAPEESEAPAEPPTQKEPSTGAPPPAAVPQTGNGNNGPPSTKEPQK
jgi:hypothetical protein